MNILIDTDVLIDVALDRKPFEFHAGKLIDQLQQMPGVASIAWHSVANFYYLVKPQRGSKDTLLFVEDLLKFVSIAPTVTEDVLFAISLDMTDFEDGLQVAAALAARASYIVSRNARDFKRSPVPVVSPKGCIELFDK